MGIIKNPYLAIAAGVLIAAGNIGGLYSIEIMAILLTGIVGVGSLAQLRDKIKSVGKTTYIVAAVGGLTVGAYAFNLIDEQKALIALSIILPVTAQRAKHGLDKANQTS